jgi:hypothetical protein
VQSARLTVECDRASELRSTSAAVYDYACESGEWDKHALESESASFVSESGGVWLAPEIAKSFVNRPKSITHSAN